MRITRTYSPKVLEILAEYKAKGMLDVREIHFEVDDVVSDCKRIDEGFDFYDVVEKHCPCSSIGDGIWFFLNFWSAIPKQHLYETYKDQLSMGGGERGYYNDFFGNNILEAIRNLNKHDTVENPELISLLDKDGYLPIYHGHCKKTLRGSHSWTINKDVAGWFGNRNALFNSSSNYYVVSGLVRLDDVIAYITNRNESEIVVLNKSVRNKKKEFFQRNDDMPKPQQMEVDIDSIKAKIGAA